MRILRISTTTLDAFDRYRRGLKPEAELLATITRTFTPTRRMRLGRHYGKVLEDPEATRVPGGYASGGFRFEADSVEPALATIDRRGLFEVKHTKRYLGHTVVSKVDYIDGVDVTEFKVRVGSVRLDGYARSYQWRFELDILQALSVTYRVFRLTEGLALSAIEELPLYGYPGLHADCCDLVQGFVAYVRRRGLEGYLPDHDEDRELGARPDLGEAFEDGPVREAPTRTRAEREGCAPVRPAPVSGSIPELRSSREVDVDLPLPPFDLQPVAPVAALPDPVFTLRSPSPAGRPRQALLF